jgi:acetoin utilization deacetylase AcuC-like enzyme
LLTHERYLWHDTGTPAGYIRPTGFVQPYRHYENAETKRRFLNLLRISGLADECVRLDPRPATEAEVLRLHTPGYLERIRALSAGEGGDAGEPTTRVPPGALATALLAAGGAIVAVDAVLDGTVDTAYALVRPPGHHALADEGMGFCIFGNTAIAALHARHARGLARVAIVDWDVHHGNGTQAAFWDDPSVLAISLHQDDCFPPGSGTVAERGGARAEGTTINVPLPPGSGRGAYLHAFEHVVVPALRAFRPDLILVASGLDASNHDPLARMMLTVEDYREMTRVQLGVADELCGGRLVAIHEGGYSAEYVPFCGHAIVEELAGSAIRAGDPFANPRVSPTTALQPHQAAAIEAAATGLAR